MAQESWVDLIVRATKDSESPERYFWWSALACLSATVRKNVYLDRFYYKLYPNVFVMLISARSGLRKGVPIALASSLLDAAGNTRVISGRNSIQGIVKEFSQQRTLENGIVLSEAQGILLSDEFASYVVDDSSALTILTGLHNTHEHEKGWKNTLKNSPVEELKNPCICLLAASNETLFNSVVQSKDMEGGFLARTFIIYESKRRHINSLMYRPEGMVSKSDLVAHLKEVAKIKGEFTLSAATRKNYDEWYHTLSKKEVNDRTGSVERLGDQVLKVAMLVSVSNRLNLEITLDDLDIAIEKSEECIAGIRQVSTTEGKSESSGGIALVLKELLVAPNHTAFRKNLLSKLWTHIDAISLDRVMDTLYQSGAIEAPFKDTKGRICYKMLESVAVQYKEFQKDQV